MPILCEYDNIEVISECIDDGYNFVSLGDSQTSSGQETILNIDDQQCRLFRFHQFQKYNRQKYAISDDHVVYMCVQLFVRMWTGNTPEIRATCVPQFYSTGCFLNGQHSLEQD